MRCAAKTLDFDERLHFFSGPLPDLAGRVAVEFFEHAAEQFVIAEAMFIQNFEYGLIGCADIMINMAEAHMVYMLRKRNPYILAEHAAEIVAVEAEDRGYLLQ